MRWFLSLLLLTAAPLVAADRPNVVFFLVDDLGWKDLGCFGSSFYETPNADRLAASGTRFTNAYAACPVCSPTRASILTGKYPQRVGITDYISPTGGNLPSAWKRNTKLLPATYNLQLALDEVTLAEVLKDAGYATFFAGKWHLGNEGHFPEDQGFDINRGGLARGGPYGGDRYFSPYGNARLTDGPPGEHLPARLARETAQFIEDNEQGPFFAYLSFYSVHTPLMARDDLQRKYRAKARQLGFEGLRWLPEAWREARQIQDHAVYAGMVEAMDSAVGVVLDTLQRLDLEDNTLVFFMSDNGGLSTSEGSPTSNVPLRGGKGWIYEGGIREPMMIRAPGVTKPGTVSDHPVTSNDFFPTILELAGLPLQPERHLDGKSLVPLLKGKSFQRGPLFWHYPHYGNQGGAPSAAVRQGDWKLIEWFEDGKLELFNLRADIGERYNLAELQPGKRDRLAALLKDWRQRAGVKMPSDNPNYSPGKLSGRRP